MVPGKTKRIFCLDDDHDLRNSLVDVLEIVGGFTAVGFASLKELSDGSKKALLSDIAIIDINLGPELPNGIDAYHWLQKKSFKGRTIFLTGHARSHPLVASVYSLDSVEILEKPVSIDKLLGIVERVPL